jgi:sporulation protein YlmC with PRC-barrel domain
MRSLQILSAIVVSTALSVPNLISAVHADVAGSTLLGVTVIEARQVAEGWSTTRQVLGQSVYNDKAEKIGTVDDVIISPDKALSYAIVGVGGFLNLGKHEVAVPVNQFTQQDGKLILAGATADALKAMPVFEYAGN